MKTKLFIIAIIVFVTSIFSVSVSAVTKQWTHDFGTDTNDLSYSVAQIAADGKGGCAVVWNMLNTDTYTNTAYITYFDKKGNKVWEKSYFNRYAEVAYCTKKMIILAVHPRHNWPGNKVVITIDKKGQETVFENPALNIDGEFNNETIPLGDKKGFFVERKVLWAGKCSLVRYTYK